MGFFDDDERDDKETVEDGKLFLRREELDVAKDRFQSGEVNLRKEIIEEQKTIDVPVTHEEVIIERRAIDNEFSDTPIGEEESIHIPVTEERVEVGKHTVITGEVLASKRAVEDTKRIDETIKREEARVDVEGDPNIVHDDLR
ncbi:MAG TPA: YsnF/AvaK domain-containing protein [Desulfobacteria bacterium]|nr:YsnF/AvaK domain-containing protein [Desulfobacteria bacterium]